MAWFNNPSVWLVIIGMLIVIGVMIFGMVPKKTLKPFKPTVAGTVSQVSDDSVINFITDMDDDKVRALIIMSPDVYERKRAQMGRAMELYSLIDKRVFPEIYEKVFKASKDNIASVDDLGGILLSHHNDKRLEIYTMSASEEGEPILTADQRFNSKRQAADTIRRFYHQLRRNFSDYLVVIVSGPNLTDLDELVGDYGETILDIDEEDEQFGMYGSSLSSWLSHHPSGSSVDRYMRNGKQNVSSVNNAMHAVTDYIPYDEEIRFQTPPMINPQFSNHIRTTDASLNLGDVNQQEETEGTTSLELEEITEGFTLFQ